MEPNAGARRLHTVMTASAPISLLGQGATVSTTLADRYRDEAPRAIRLAYLMTGDQALAEDLVHDAFIKASGRLFALRNPEAFGPYLRRSVVNLVRSHFRHQQVARRHLEQIAQEPAPEHHTTDTETRDALWNALQTLPVRQREAIVCRYYLDLSERETAESMGCRPGTVKSSLSRGLDALRGTLDQGTVMA